MKTRLIGGWGGLTVAALLLAWTHAASGQTFSSGSTGADGAFTAPFGASSITVKPGGVYNFTTVNIPNTSTLTYLRGSDNSPLVILATGNVTIDGQILVNGSNGNTTGANPIVGGLGGPGGFNGGVSGASGFVPTAGEGPAGGQPIATGGGNGGAYGAPTSFVGLTPLFGGSGGAGTSGNASGGGGGGAILIASSTRITINGSIRANGGNSGNIFGGCNVSGAGAGGAIRLVAPEITGGTAGLIQALGGPGVSGCGFSAGGVGRIRVEASNFAGFVGQTNPVPSIANAPGPVSPAGSPSLVNVPTLTIASIGGLATPTTPTGSYSVPDLTLAPGTANPISVVINATNTPVAPETQINVRVISRSPGTVSTVIVPAANHTGSFATSSATVSVTLPVAQVTLFQAFATMTLTGQTASLFPLIDGEPVERVMVAASPGQPSTVSLVTKSGKEVRVDQLRFEDQVRVAQAWEALRATRVE